MGACLSIKYPVNKYCTPALTKRNKAKMNSKIKIFLTGEKFWKLSGLHIRVTNRQSKITRQARGTWLLWSEILFITAVSGFNA